MAEGKNKIVVYRDWINTFDSLNNDEAGKLIKHFFKYVNDKNPEPPDRLTQLLFEPIKQTLKRDLAKYMETCDKNRGNVKNKWGKDLCQINSNKRSERLRIAREKGTHSNEDWIEIVEYFGECVKCGSTDRLVKDHIIPIYQGGSDGLDNLQPLCAKCNSSKGPDNTDYRTSFCSDKNIKMPTKCLPNTSTPTDSDSDSDSDSDIDKKKKDIPNLEQVKEYCKERNNNVDADKWFNFYCSKGWMIGKNKMKDWKAAVRTWETKKPEDRPITGITKSLLPKELQ